MGALTAFAALAASAASAAAPVIPAVAPAAREAAQVGQSVPATAGLGGTLAALMLVVALIILLAWVLKKLPGTGLRSLPGLRVVATLPVGPRERAVVIDCGGQQLLLGVTAHSISLLHTLTEPLLDAPTQAGFAELLARLKARDSA